MQVNLQAAMGVMFSFSSSVSPKYGAPIAGIKGILNSIYMKIIHQEW